jgi:hypothetical protein
MRGAGLVTVILLAARVAWADGVSASVDRTEASLQDEIILTLTVEGSRSAQPSLPPLPDFDVRGRGQSTQVHIINGSMTTAASFSYALAPKRPGTFTIGPATVEIDGKVYRSEPFSVSIGAAPVEPQEGGTAFVTAEVSTRTPVVGEQVVYTWRFFRRVRIGNASVSMPSFEGFFAQDLGGQREYQATVRGQQYLVTEVRKALFPQDPGPQTLPATSLQIDVLVGRNSADDGFGSPFDDLFGRVQHQTKTLRTAPIEVHVSPLPPAPAGFTGLVGDFRLDAEVSQRQLRVGESTTLTLTVSGSGNAINISEPKLSALQGFKVYDDKPVATLNVKGDALVGSKVFKKALVPTQPGVLTIPALDLVFYDPARKSYRTSSSPSFALQVAPGAAADDSKLSVRPTLGLPAGKTDVQILGDDLLPLYKRADALRRRPGTPQTLAVSGGLGVPPVAYLLLLLWQRRREHGRDPAVARARKALKQSLKALGEVAGALSKGQATQAAAAASRAIRAYLGDKLRVEGMALTAAEARDHLVIRGVDPGLAQHVERLLSRCEAAQYGAPTSRQELATLPGELKTVLTHLEKALRA